MVNVKIYQQGKSAMQSGRIGVTQWVLEVEAYDARFIEPLMGWVGTRDNSNQIRIFFPTKEKAFSFAQENGMTVRVISPRERKVVPKSYADNFKWDPKV